MRFMIFSAALLVACTGATAQVFAPCLGNEPTCVVDGDTFRWLGTSIRIENIDAPEVRGAGCAAEAVLGAKATERLAGLLSGGDWRLERNPADPRDKDRYGRQLRRVIGPLGDIGEQLVKEDLARAWTGRRAPWCG